MIEFRFFKVKPNKLMTPPDFVEDFVSLEAAREWWFESEYDSMHMMTEDGDGLWPVSYVKVDE